MKFIRALLIIIACALIGVIGYSGYQIYGINQDNVQEANMHNRLMQYRPETPELLSTDSAFKSILSEPTLETPTDLTLDETANIVNQSIVDLQTVHPDAVGWLTVPNTKIDYPFAQGQSNDTYLHLDLDQSRSAAGTLFMDFRNNSDFSDFNTIIFGHHMRSGSMFGTLQQFNNQAFFENNRNGTIFLADKTYAVEFIAFSVIFSDDAVIYNPVIMTDTQATEFLDHVKNSSRYYRDVGVTANDRFVTLSTCNYEFEDARMVLIGRLTEM